MKRLLVPMDFSEESVHAFRFALDLGRQSNGTVHILHVISMPVIHESPLIPMGVLKKELFESMRTAAENKFKDLIKQFNSEGIRTEFSVVNGRIHRAILGCINRLNTDLVVMGTKGAAGIKEWTVGSNTEKVVRTSPVPIISVKHYREGHSIRNIIFPNTLDTENQEELVMKVKALQDFFKARLHIIWVNTPALFKPHGEARERLKAFAKRFMLRDYTINVFSYTDEETGILEFTNQMNGDLIALGTHGSTGILHFLNGSVAEDIVNHVRHPVWTYCTKYSNRVSTQKQP